jgi:hypothetical protein
MVFVRLVLIWPAGLGEMLRISGLIAAFLRVSQASGRFTRAVAEVVTTDAVLGHVSELHGLNVRLTRG